MATRKMTDRAAEAWLSEPVTVHLFRDNGSYKEDKIVTVNGETVRIPRGEDVTIARRFALVLAQGEAQDARTGALIERETARFAAESGALGSEHGDASAGAHAHRRDLPKCVGRRGKDPVAQRVRAYDPDAHPRRSARAVRDL